MEQDANLPRELAANAVMAWFFFLVGYSASLWNQNFIPNWKPKPKKTWVTNANRESKGDHDITTPSHQFWSMKQTCIQWQKSL